MKTFCQLFFMYAVGLMLLPLAPMVALLIILEDFYYRKKKV